MKYCYEGSDLSQLIRNYEKTDDKIIINYFNKTSCELPLTDLNEENIQKIMLEQAILRSNSSSMCDSSTLLSKSKLFLIPWLLFGCTNIRSLSLFNFSTRSDILDFIFIGVSGIVLVLNGVVIKINSDEIKELKKYDIYLEIRDALEKYSNIFNSFDLSDKQLNINTLDNYSLKDLQNIKSKLSKYLRKENKVLKLDNKK